MAPQLRGLLQRALVREILTAVGLGLVAGAGYWYALVLPRRRRYEDFYRNYDAKAVAESMTASFEEGALQMGNTANVVTPPFSPPATFLNSKSPTTFLKTFTTLFSLCLRPLCSSLPLHYCCTIG